MQIKEAVLLVKDTQKSVSLQDIKIEAEVLDLACSTSIVQTYRNTEKKAIEAVYCFPVEEGAAVYDFEIKTDGKTLKGVVEERDKAFETYDKAIEKGDASFLLDQESGDILFISVGNFKPDQEVTVIIRYVKQLSLVDGIVRLQIPTTVSPRYAPSDTDPVKVDRITPDYDFDVPYRLGINVKLKSEFIEDVSSPSHKITSSKDGKYTIISLANGTTILDRDFVLEIKAVNPNKPVCLWSTHENGDKACMFRFTPHFDELQVGERPKSEIIFVLDCSGSMQGSSIREAKLALKLSLGALSEGDMFNIIRFGNNYESYRSESIVFSNKSLKEALDYLQRIHADMGGTEILGPLKHICSLPAQEGYTRDVLLLTDGEVANPDEVIHLVADSVDKSQFLRFFTIGIGYGASHHLVKGIARAGRGACEMIMSGEKIQPTVLRQFARMGQPSLTDVSLNFQAAEAESENMLPPLFEGDSYTVYRKIERVTDGANVTLSGNFLGNHYSWDAKLVGMNRDNIVPTLWVLSKIKRLKTMGVGGSNQRGRKEQSVKNEITKLGLRYNLLTDYTSFVAVEVRVEDKKQLKQPEYRRIPVMMTRDWHGISSQVVGMSYKHVQYQQMLTLGRVGKRRLDVDELTDKYVEKAIEPHTIHFPPPPWMKLIDELRYLSDIRNEYFEIKQRIKKIREGELEQFFKRIPSLDEINQLEHRLSKKAPSKNELTQLIKQFPLESELLQLFKKAPPMAELEQLVKKSPTRGYFERLMIQVFVSEKAEEKWDKKEKAPWHVWLLRSQKEDGAFFGGEILKYFFGNQFRFVSSAKIVDVPLSSDVWFNIRPTWLAVTLLSADSEAAVGAGSEIQKAKKWLSQHNAQSLTVKGVPIKEAFEKEFGMKLI